MRPRLLRLIRFSGWFGGMTFMGIAVAMAVGRVDSEPARVPQPLDNVVKAISVEMDQPVMLARNFALWPEKQRGFWILEGAVLVQSDGGTLERRPFRARVRGLCRNYRMPRCWGLDAMKRGPGTGPAVAPAPSRLLTGGARVRGIQKRLKNLGWNPGPLDGAMGPRTRTAIREYQRRFGLKEAGRPTGALLDHLEVNVLFAHGLAAFNAGKFHEAARHYSQAIALRPKHSGGYFNRGLVYRRLALPELAIRDYGVALSLDQSNTRVLYDRGNAYVEMGRYGAATLDYADSLGIWLFGGSGFARVGQEVGGIAEATARAVR